MANDVAHPLFTMHFVGVLPWLNAFLGLVFILEVGYALMGEKRLLVGLDGVVSATGIALMIWFLTRSASIAVPGQVNEAAGAIHTLNQLMNKVVQLILISFAGVFAMESVKRFIRLGQIWK